MYLCFKPIAFSVLAIVIFSSAGFCQMEAGLAPKIYTAGYRELKGKDTTRQYKPGVSLNHPLFYRPVEVDLWYPAKSNSIKPLTFRYFLSLFERRANSFQDSIKYTGIANEMWADFTISEVKSVMPENINTKSHLSALAAKGEFPVIIYMSAYNGMSYENIPLFENLASHGYIVAAVSSIGRYPGNMTTNPQDVLEQVKDAEFTLQLLANQNINIAKVGVVGWSYGGLAGTLLAMQNKSVKSVLSLDGSEHYAYGTNTLEDSDFNDLRKSQYLTAIVETCSYAYLSSDEASGTTDSIYHLNASARKNQYIQLIDTKHEDFSCLNALGRYTGTHYELVNTLALSYFNQTLLNEGDVFDQAVAIAITQKKAIPFPDLPAKIPVHRINLTGTVLSSETGQIIPFASVGVPSAGVGTVADSLGVFSLQVISPDALVRISSLGFQSRTFKAKELMLLLANSPIKLRELPNQLKEVVIKVKSRKVRRIGNTSKSTFLGVGFPVKDLGSEVGIQVPLGKKKMLLRSFNFNVSYSRIDTGILRINIYAFNKGKIADNLLSQNILFGIGKKAGDHTIDLMPYHLNLQGDILISLEAIASKSKKGGMVYFSAGLLSSAYHRYATEGDWVKSKGLGVSFNLLVQEVD